MFHANGDFLGTEYANFREPYLNNELFKTACVTKVLFSSFGPSVARIGTFWHAILRHYS